MKRVLLAAALVAVFLSATFAVWYFYQLPQTDVSPVRTLQLGGQTIHISVAASESVRQQGLSGRTGLAADEGMLFVFPEDGKYAFWMKDMRFSIDILWLSADGRVVYMALNVSPDTYPQVFRPDVPARYVLELPAGYAKAHAVRVGDIVRL